MLRIGLFCFVLGLNVGLAATGYSQDFSALKDGLTLKGLMMMILPLLPVLWQAVSPLAIAAITKGVNMVMSKYVPREVQVILASVLGGVLAGTASAAAGDFNGVVTAGTTIAGGVSQVYTATPPEKLLTTAPPEASPDKS